MTASRGQRGLAEGSRRGDRPTRPSSFRCGSRRRRCASKGRCAFAQHRFCFVRGACVETMKAGPVGPGLLITRVGNFPMADGGAPAQRSDRPIRGGMHELVVKAGRSTRRSRCSRSAGNSLGRRGPGSRRRGCTSSRRRPGEGRRFPSSRDLRSAECASFCCSDEEVHTAGGSAGPGRAVRRAPASRVIDRRGWAGRRPAASSSSTTADLDGRRRKGRCSPRCANGGEACNRRQTASFVQEDGRVAEKRVAGRRAARGGYGRA